MHGRVVMLLSKGGAGMALNVSHAWNLSEQAALTVELSCWVEVQRRRFLMLVSALE